jgi:hypothetical protein
MKMLLLIVLASTVLDAHATVFPMGGRQAQAIMPGRVMQIGWNDDLDARAVDIGLWDGTHGTLTLIAQQVDASVGTYAWSVPLGLPYGERYRIMVRDSDQPRRAEYSKSFLTIGTRPRPVVAHVDDIDRADDVRVEPFPASERLTVSWRDRSVERVEMYDLQRRPVMSTSVDPMADRLSVNVGGVASGLYYIKLTHTGGNVVVVPAMIGR